MNMEGTTGEEKADPGGKWYSINRRLLPVKVFYFFSLGAVGDLLPYISLYMKQIGLSSNETGVIYGVMPFIGFLVRPITGMLADKFHKHKLLLVVSCILTGVFYCLLLAVPYTQLGFTKVKATIDCNQYDSYLRDCYNPNSTENSCPMSFDNYLALTVPGFELNSFVPNTNSSSHYELLSELDTSISNMLQCTSVCKSVQKQSKVCFTNSVDGYNPISCLTDVLNIDAETSLTFKLHNLTSVLEREVASDRQLYTDGICRDYNLKSVQYEDETYWQMLCKEDTEFECELQCTTTSNENCLGSESLKAPATLGLFFVFFLFGNIFFAPIISLGDAMTYDILGERRGQWGKQRLWGTIGFALFAVSSTFIMDRISKNPLTIDYSVSFYIFVVMFTLAGVVSYKIDASENIVSSNMFKGARQLFSYPAVVIFLTMQLCFGILQAVIETFLYWYIQDHLNNRLQIIPGLCLLVSCLAEIPMLFFSGWIIKRIGHLNCLYLCFLAYCLRFFFYSILENPWQVLPVELLHIFNYGLMWAAATSYVSIIAPEGMSATIQGLIGGLHFGCGKGIGSLVTGILYNEDVLGPVWTFRFYSALSLFLAILSFLVNRFCIAQHPHKGPSNAGQEGDVRSEQEREQRQALTDINDLENNLHPDMKTTL